MSDERAHKEWHNVLLGLMAAMAVFLILSFLTRSSEPMAYVLALAIAGTAGFILAAALNMSGKVERVEEIAPPEEVKLLPAAEKRMIGEPGVIKKKIKKAKKVRRSKKRRT